MKRFGTCCFLLLILSLTLSGLVLAQTQTGEIRVLGVPDRFKSANINEVTTGLATVGVGQRVVLAPRVLVSSASRFNDTNKTVLSAVWSVAGPKGAVAIADTGSLTGGKIVYFVPDTVGAFTVTMTATTANGAAPSMTSIINAAWFVGAGISTMNASGVPVNCTPCHNGSQFSKWAASQHAIAVKYKVNDALGHFGNSCMSCHSIGYDTLAVAKNGGFDEAAKAEGFTINRNGPLKHDTLVTMYPNSMKLSGIQCENCHGPAGTHAKTGNKAVLSVSMSSDVCAPCHFSSDRHAVGYQWAASGHAVTGNPTGSRPNRYNQVICATCHISEGFMNEFIDGKPQPVPAVPKAEKAYPTASQIGCATCHDPHSGANPAQLRVKSIGEACVGCHVMRLSATGMHSAHQAGMLIGSKGKPFTAQNFEEYYPYAKLPSTSQIVAPVAKVVQNWGGWQYPGYTYENSPHADIKDRCAVCHMAPSPGYDPTYAKADTLINKLGGHTFKVANTAGRDTLLNTNGCVSCHPASRKFVELIQTETKAMLFELYKILPKRDSSINTTTRPMGAVISPFDTALWQAITKPINLADRRKLSIVERAAAYNYMFVNNDLSYGVHNFAYAKGLIRSSIEQLKLGAGAAPIVQIKDVPGDHGRNVQIVWNHFPAEDAAYGRVMEYGIWRQDPMLSAPQGTYKEAKMFQEMINSASIGDKYAMGGVVWTYVASVPAINAPLYSFIAPTLIDSAKVGGMKWSVFYVSGQTGDPNVVYRSPIDSGYSVDNIPPLAPVNAAVAKATDGVSVTWKVNTGDPDVVAYEIFRSTVADFVPAAANKIAKVNVTSYLDRAVTNGVLYYYRIRGIDFSGNEGALSPQLSITVTDVKNNGGVPTEFALDQNHPNPFNPSTQIKFALPQASFVKIGIYSVSGNLITTLVNDNLEAGYYTTTWSGKNSNGETVATGVYLYRIEAGSFSSTKKMLMVK